MSRDTPPEHPLGNKTLTSPIVTSRQWGPGIAKHEKAAQPLGDPATHQDANIAHVFLDRLRRAFSAMSLRATGVQAVVADWPGQELQKRNFEVSAFVS